MSTKEMKNTELLKGGWFKFLTATGGLVPAVSWWVEGGPPGGLQVGLKKRPGNSNECNKVRRCLGSSSFGFSTCWSGVHGLSLLPTVQMLIECYFTGRTSRHWLTLWMHESDILPISSNTFWLIAKTDISAYVIIPHWRLTYSQDSSIVEFRD